MHKIVIFGSSGCKPGSEEYSTAVKLGNALASAGFDVVTGGYSGTMEAISLGASEIGIGKIEGVIVPSLFPNRPALGNKFLNVVTTTSTLMERLSTLIASSDVYIVLPGSVGTLGELVLVWNHINIDFRVHKESKKHLVCFREPWERFVHQTRDTLNLMDQDLQQIYFIDTIDEAVTIAANISGKESTD